MNEEPVPARVNRWDSRARKHEVEIRRGDRPVELVQRRASGHGSGRQARRMFEWRAHTDRCRWHPRHLGRIVRHCGLRLRSYAIGEGQCASGPHGPSQQDPAAEA